MNESDDPLDLAPLESLAADRLHTAGAPHPAPAAGRQVGELRQWALDRPHADRVAAGVAIAITGLRHHYQRQRDGYEVSTASIVKQMETLAEWKEILQFIHDTGRDSDEFASVRELYTHADLGLDTRDQRRAFANRANQERHAKAESRHKRWLAEDQRLANERPRLTSKRARAQAIRKALNESASDDHIARHLPPPR